MNKSKSRIDIHKLAPKPITNRRSVVLVSLHKAATSYFSGVVLKQVAELVNIDYQAHHYEIGDRIEPVIISEGYIYGVLRVYDDNHPGKMLTESVIAASEKRGLDLVILIRDPRDLIVSMYYSFGFSHGLSQNEDIRQYQLTRRERIQSMSIDEYAVYVLPELKRKVEFLIALALKNEHVKILKYEEMIEDFKPFFKDLQRVIPVPDDFESKMYADTRPQHVENIGSHRRSGKVNGYKSKLKHETIHLITNKLRKELEYFHYI